MKYLLSIFFSFLVLGLHAQVDRENQEENVTNLEDISTGDTLVITQKDTLSDDIYAFDLDHVTDGKLYADTLLSSFYEYELSRKTFHRYTTTGNVGSSAFPIMYSPNYKSGFELGHRQHQLYQFQADDIRFYDLEKPYSQVYFTPAQSQASFTSSALFARDFAKGVKLSIHFNRINSENTYVNQETRHTYIHTGIFQQIDSSRWAYSLNFLSNSNYEDLNGGISEYTGFNIGGLADIRTGIPTYLNDAYTYNLKREYLGQVYYFLQKKENIKQYLSAKIDISNNIYKFIDPTQTTADSVHYGGIYDTSELGYRLHNSLFTNELDLNYHLNTERIKLRAYGTYRLHQLTTDVEKKAISDGIVGLESSFDWKGLGVSFEGFVGVSEGLAISLLNPEIHYEYKSWLSADLGLKIHVRPPDYVENTMLITSNDVYQNDFGLSTIQEIYGDAKIERIGLEGGFKSIIAQNLIYLNGETKSFDILDDLTMLQIYVGDQYHFFKKLLFSNYIFFQSQNTAVYGMPAWYSKHQLAFDGTVFKTKLWLHAGVDFDYYPNYELPGFHEPTSRLYRTGSEAWADQFRFDAHLAFRVQGLRFFIKYENISYLWKQGRIDFSGYDLLYQVENYPQLDGRLRIGASWALRN